MRRYGGTGGRSCCPLVLVDESAEDLAAPYPRRREVGDRGGAAVIVVGWPEVPGPVRAMLVIVRDVLAQDSAQVPLAQDEHPVGAFGADGAYEPLGDGVGRCRRLHPIQMIGTGVSG